MTFRTLIGNLGGNKDKTGKSEPIKEHWQISDASWKKFVGGLKQQRIENSIIKGEENKITFKKS